MGSSLATQTIAHLAAVWTLDAIVVPSTRPTGPFVQRAVVIHRDHDEGDLFAFVKGQPVIDVLPIIHTPLSRVDGYTLCESPTDIRSCLGQFADARCGMLALPSLYSRHYKRWLAEGKPSEYRMWLAGGSR